MNTPTPALALQGLTRRHPGVVALDSVDLTLLRGEVHALAGENGAGKSSLIKILCGADRADAGSMQLFGQPYAPHNPLDAMRAGIRVVHQELHMLDELSVAENLLFEHLPRKRAGGWLGLLDRRELNRRATELLALVGLDDLAPSTRVATLGMAQRQLIEIAKALSGDSRVVIMDEPTATLTPRETDRLLQLIRQLRARGVTVVFVSHHLQELFEVCDRVTVLRNGRKVATQAMAETTTEDLVRLMVGRDLAERAHRAAPVLDTQRAPALRVEGLRFRGQRGDAPLAFELRYGEIVGLAGLVGAGRTELARAIFGADPVARGRILVEGREVRIRSPIDAIRAGIGLVPEDRKLQALFLSLAIRDNLSVAAMDRLAGTLGFLKKREEAELVESFRKKLGIKMASAEQAGAGIAILAISSELPEILTISDRIVTMREGRITGEVMRAEASEERLMQLMALAGTRAA
jgi:ribose transport system ATP-binding protein